MRQKQQEFFRTVKKLFKNAKIAYKPSDRKYFTELLARAIKAMEK